MKNRPARMLAALALAALAGLTPGGVRAQSTTAPQPSSQGQQGMAEMPGMGGAPSSDMAIMMKQCALMKAQMKAGMRMTPDMQPMMDRCGRMDRSMGATKAPDDTLSR